MTRTLATIVALALALIGAPVAAQSCQLPATALSPPAATPDGPVRSLPIASYVLALTWAPAWCSGHAGDPDASRECNGAHARFGFVLHGLWPDAAPDANGRPTWPQWCPATPPATTRVPATIVRQMLCTTPSPTLIAHEWAKHGTCMAVSAQAYFGQSSAMFRALRYPDMAALARRRSLTAGDFRRAFADANPRYAPAAIGLLLTHEGDLQEVHLCHDRMLHPGPCAIHDVADAAPIRIAAP